MADTIDLSELSLEELQAEVARRRPAGMVRAHAVSNISVGGHLIPAGTQNVLMPRELAEEMLRRGHVAKPQKRTAPAAPAPPEEEDADE